MNIIRIMTDDQIRATARVMRELRPHIAEGEYLPMVRRMMATNAYRLAAVVEEGLDDENAVLAVAGYRYMELLYCGKILYVDDLNTRPEERSQGYGKILLNWLKDEAKAEGCLQLHLDSGVQRTRTHRFYFREGLTISDYHFYTVL
jgi:GNAT superfamily N-acetyltransferase